MVKSILYIHIIILFLSSSILGQKKLTPSSSNTLVILEVLNPDDSPYKNALVKLKDDNMNEFKATTNSKGVLKALVPVGNKYMVNCSGLKNELLINISNRGYATWSGTRYTHRFIEFTFNFKDYQNQPVDQEKIFTVLDSGDSLVEKTDQYGKAKFFVPIARAFEVSTKHKVIKSFNVPDDGYEAISLNFKYQGQSSKSIEKEQKEAQLAQIEYEKQQKIRDSIRAREDSVRSTQPTVIIFFASDSEMRHLGEISVFDGNKDGVKLGTVNSVWSCHSGPAVKDAEVKFEKMKGHYSYYAKSSQGYEWEGSYEITGGGWERIILEISDGKKAMN